MALKDRQVALKDLHQVGVAEGVGGHSATLKTIGSGMTGGS
jgi:hypothetical protein